MDLSRLVHDVLSTPQTTHPSVTFSRATVEDIVSRYSVKNKNSPSMTNKTPGTIKTTMSALDLAYNRVHGVLPGVSLQNHGRP